MLAAAIAITALFTNSANAIPPALPGSSFSTSEIPLGVYAPLGETTTLTSSGALQNILRNTHRSDEYEYPTDFTRDISPVGFCFRRTAIGAYSNPADTPACLDSGAFT